MTIRQPSALDVDAARQEQLLCSLSPVYFLWHYVWIYDAIARNWVLFRLWPMQRPVMDALLQHRQIVILKARQLGMTWLTLAYGLWLALFRPEATVMLFSRRDDEAVDLLRRFKGMYHRLPSFLQAKAIAEDNEHRFQLSNGSRALAFPTNTGDSYTGTLVIADEFDLVPDQAAFLGSVKPTIDNGGQIVLLSRPDKGRPQSPFKNIYRAAVDGENGYFPVFLPWYAHPGRDQEWYEAQRRDAISIDGSLDWLHEQYPATDVEALAARTLDKRFAPEWLSQCYEPAEPLTPDDAPSIPGLRIYETPVRGYRYVIGADPAEGNPTSDDSALTVRCRDTGNEVASLAGKYQPTTFAAHIDAISRYFNTADVMVERNNHGHAVIAWLKDNAPCKLLNGHDGRPGWLSSSKGKALLYDAAADAYRHREVTVHTFKTFNQLASIEGATLRAPEGEHDDLADSDALAIVAMTARTVSVAARQARVKGRVARPERIGGVLW